MTPTETNSSRSELDFRDFYSRQQLGEYHRLQQDNRTHDQGDGDAAEKKSHVDAWLDALRQFEESLYEFLAEKSRRGELKPVPFVDERGLRWGNHWNRLVSGELSKYDEPLQLTGGMGLYLLSTVFGHKGDSDEPAQALSQAYERLVDKVSIGTHIEPSSAYGECRRTGRTFHMQMGPGWMPQYGTFDGNKFVPLDRGIGPREVCHVEIPVPTGELLMGDWFRIKAFTQAVEKPDLPSLNSEAGCIETMRHYAGLGLLSVFVGNTMPRVIQRDEQLLVAQIDWDDDKGDAQVAGEVRGAICTDLWWASAIDRQVLTNIVARQAGQQEAARLVAEMLQKQDIQTLQVAPGTYHAYWGSEAGLQKEFACDEVDASNLETLYAVISDKPLEWRPRPANKKAVKPR